MGINWGEVQTKSKQKADEVLGKGGRDERLLNLNKTNTIQFVFVPDLTEGASGIKINEVFGQYNFLDRMGKNHFAGTAPHTLPQKDGQELDDVVLERKKELYGNIDNKMFGSMYPKIRALFNVYVVDDTENPENNGTFKVINCGYTPQRAGKDGNIIAKSGAPIRKFFESLQDSPDGEEVTTKKLGKKNNVTYPLPTIMGMSPDGYVLCQIDITKTGDTAPDYDFSHELNEENLFNLKGEDEIMELITEKAHDLTEFIEEPKSRQELNSMVDKHLLGITTSNSVDMSEVDDDPLGEDEGDDDEIPMEHPTDVKPESTKESKPEESKDLGEGEISDADLDALLNED